MSPIPMNLARALASLDPVVDEHWTSDGLPRMDALVTMTGDTKIARQDVIDAAPGFTRDIAVANALAEPVGTAAPEPDAEAVPEPAASTEPAAAPLVTDIPAGVSALPGLAPGASVLDMRRGDVLASAELTQAALGEIEQKITEAQGRLAEVEQELKQLYAKNDILSRVAEKHHRSRPSKDRENAVQTYLKGQAAVREMRAKRATEFLRSGTTIADVQSALAQRSKLDQAMAHGRAAPGAARPAPLSVR